MAVKIKLMRMGKIRAPHYRIVVADSRTKRDGRAIETIGRYFPTYEPSLIDVDSTRAQYWLGVGAQPTEPVLAILKKTGDWQRHRGEQGAEGSVKTAAPRADKRAAFESAAREGGDAGAATTARSRRGSARQAAAEAAEGTVDAARPSADEAAAAGDVRAAGSGASAEEASATAASAPGAGSTGS